MASVMTLDYLKSEAAKADRRYFDQFLARVPHAPVTSGDEMPKG